MRVSISTLFFFVSININVYCQTALKFAPLLSVRLEHKLTDRTSIQFGVMGTGYVFFGQGIITSFSGGIRIYKNQSMRGWYLFPLATSTKMKYQTAGYFFEAPENYTNRYFSLGALIGRQWIGQGGFTFDIGLGAAKGKLLSSVGISDGSKDFLADFHPKFTFALGYTWGRDKIRF